MSEKTIRDIWMARTWHHETLPWDLNRLPKKIAKSGRPLGRKDNAPRRPRTKTAGNQPRTDATCRPVQTEFVSTPSTFSDNYQTFNCVDFKKHQDEVKPILQTQWNWLFQDTQQRSSLGTGNDLAADVGLLAHRQENSPSQSTLALPRDPLSLQKPVLRATPPPASFLPPQQLASHPRLLAPPVIALPPLRSSALDPLDPTSSGCAIRLSPIFDSSRLQGGAAAHPAPHPATNAPSTLPASRQTAVPIPWPALQAAGWPAPEIAAAAAGLAAVAAPAGPFAAGGRCHPQAPATAAAGLLLQLLGQSQPWPWC